MLISPHIETKQRTTKATQLPHRASHNEVPRMTVEGTLAAALHFSVIRRPDPCDRVRVLADGDGFAFSFTPLNGTTDYFGENLDVIYFGAVHTAGLNAAFADGSVRTISYDIDSLNFNRLGA